MTLYDRYLSRQFLAAFARVLVALVLMVILFDLLAQRRENIDRYEVPLAAVAHYYLCFTPVILLHHQAGALAVLAAGLMTLGRAAQHGEITALLAGGVSLRRIARAPLVLALLLALAAFAAENTVAARAAAELDRLNLEYFSRIAQGERSGVSWPNLGEGWTAHLLKFNRVALTGEDVFIRRIEPDRVEEIRARRIYWDPPRQAWMLEDGRWYTFDGANGWNQSMTRIAQTPAPFTESPADLFALEASPDTKPAPELWRDLVRAAARGIPVQTQTVDFWVKFARPTLFFIMLLLAVPFAMRVRRGGAMIGMGLGLLIGLAYLLLFYAATGMGRLGQLPPLPAAFLASAVFAIAGAELFRRTPS